MEYSGARYILPHSFCCGSWHVPVPTITMTTYCSVGKNYTLQPVNKKTIIKIKNNTALQLQHRDEVGFLLIEIKLAL